METIHQSTLYHKEKQNVKGGMEQIYGKVRSFVVKPFKILAISQGRTYGDVLTEAMVDLLQKYGVAVDEEPKEGR